MSLRLAVLVAVLPILLGTAACDSGHLVAPSPIPAVPGPLTFAPPVPPVVQCFRGPCAVGDLLNP